MSGQPYQLCGCLTKHRRLNQANQLGGSNQPKQLNALLCKCNSVEKETV
jgi:hypothetical protein